MDTVLELDRQLFYTINHGWASPFLDAFFPWATRLGSWWPAVGALALWLAIFGGKRGRICLLAVVVAVAIADPLAARVVKPLVERVRPCVALDDVRLLASRRSSLSFPSAHAVNTFAAAMVFWRFYPRSIWIGVPFAAMISLTRVYIGLHYPGDIVGGAFLGAGLGLLVAWVVRRVAARNWPAVAAEPPVAT
jgi:undecaprenyl-diphosphatase